MIPTGAGVYTEYDQDVLARARSSGDDEVDGASGES